MAFVPIIDMVEVVDRGHHRYDVSFPVEVRVWNCQRLHFICCLTCMIFISPRWLYVLGPKMWFAERDKHYPSRSGQTSLATAVTNITEPVTKNNFGPSKHCCPRDRPQPILPPCLPSPLPHSRHSRLLSPPPLSNISTMDFNFSG